MGAGELDAAWDEKFPHMQKGRRVAAPAFAISRTAANQRQRNGSS